ncbi:MAG: uracil phosphoribosyltransferase [Bacteroidota bacterium]
MLKHLGKENSIVNHFVEELRDCLIQKDSMRFRRNMERIGEVFAYEISKTLEYEDKEVVTPLGTANMKLLKSYPVLTTILRAGLPLQQGLLNIYDKSNCGFISAYRKYKKNGTFHIQLENVSCPNIADKVLVIADPMLATGQSMVLAYKELVSTKGKPKHVHIVSVIASVEGIEYIKKNIGMDNCTLWVAAIDDELTAQAYIVPGLGDAGDLSYGEKEHDL